MKKNIINIACWSIGQHAIKNMLPAINKCMEVNLSGIYTRNKLRSQEQCKLYNCTQYNNETELLSDPSINAVYLSSPTGVHRDQISMCLDAGKSVLVEKTALPSLKETNDLVAKAESKGLIIMEAFMYRFHNQFIQLQKILTSKKHGEIIKIDCEFGFPHLKQDDIRYSKELAGGAKFDAGAYTISAARQLLGCNGNVIWSELINGKGFDVDTVGYATIFSNGIVVNCTWGFGLSYSNKIRVWTEKGHILCDRVFSKQSDYPSEIVVEQNGNIIEVVKTGCDNHFVNMLIYFSNQVNQNSVESENYETLLQSELISLI